jgi:hypothetical protein
MKVHDHVVGVNPSHLLTPLQLRVSVTTEGDKLDPLCGLFERSAITLTQCVIFTHTQDKVGPVCF